MKLKGPILAVLLVLLFAILVAAYLNDGRRRQARHTSTISYSKQDEKYVIYASARMVEGYYVVLHVQNMETWEVVSGDWAELEAGKRYRAETWTVQTLEDGTKRSSEKTQVVIEP